ncbi:MAG: hypothetical protein HOI19_09210, partial [Rhodospirillaceae bacterium]|nr:hypothetical protein [Rhodospirillaceae bacterium]
MSAQALKDDSVMAEEASTELTGQQAVEMDSLHILPLNIIPLVTPSLKRARIVKNVRLDSVIELFNDEDTGSGQVFPKDLGKMFNWDPKDPPPDDAMVNSLANLASYDVYTLRIQLRKAGIKVEENAALKLSKGKAAELTSYMKQFTMPLIQQIYGESDSEISDFSELIGMFSSPNQADALKNLKMMADKLKISLAEVPAFLEDYGDVFMSLAYFRDCLDRLIPMTMQFDEAMDELNESHQMRSDRRLAKSMVFVREELGDITASITGRFESFDRNSQGMWDNITADSFAKVKRLIEAHHTTVGGVLCGLTVKMDSWMERFGDG